VYSGCRRVPGQGLKRRLLRPYVAQSYPKEGRMQDRPTAPELLAAVREFLQGELVPTLGDQRQKFRALIAANVLGVVERELAGEEGRLGEEWRRLVALDGAATGAAAPPATRDALRAEVDARKRALCARIRAGEADADPWRRDVLAYARWAVEEKLRVANPRYLARVQAEGPRAND
jgi:hypothetical protein